MSHTVGEILNDKEEILGYYEYDGTCDFAIPAVWDSVDEVMEHWRDPNPTRKECTCGGEHESVEIQSNYGGGFSWRGFWCPTCRVITKYFSQHAEEEELYEDIRGGWGY